MVRRGNKKKQEPEPNWSDFDLIMTALGEANAEEFNLENIMTTVLESKNGLEFSAGVHALAQLKDLWEKHNGHDKTGSA